MQTLNAKNIALRQETLARRHRETECGPVKVGDVVLAKNIGTYYGWIDCVLICTAVVENCARFSGYTDDGNLVGQYRWPASDLQDHIANGTLTVLDPDSVGLLLTLAEAHADDARNVARTTANFDNYWELGGEERLRELVEDYL